MLDKLMTFLTSAKNRREMVDKVPLLLENRSGGGDGFISYERMLLEPSRQRGSTATAAIDDFAALVQATGKNTNTTIYYDTNGNVRAIFNDAAWRDWTIGYNPVIDESWAAWCKIDNQWMNQLGMAEFIEERVADFVEPVGASMLELAQQFDVKRSGEFFSGVRLDNGMSRLVVGETAEVRANIDVPHSVALGMRVFEDLDAYKFQALFRWRIRDNKLLLSFKLVNREQVLRTAVADLIARAKNITPGYHFYQVSALPVPTAPLA